jgi:asparagine synthase (glutamine-hydrolysing)
VCGIYGEVGRSVGAVVGGHGDEAVERLTHRGPDDRGTWHEDGVFLGVRRLSIIDLPGGSQPIWNEDRSMVIVYNGELYNFPDLRPELESRGHTFRSRTDTEVVLHAYEEWGPDCLKRFNGMFAFAIWDRGRRTLFLARDRIGEKPLYYLLLPDRLAFASELKALLADPAVPREVNPRGLANYLAFGHGMAPETILRHVYKLLPGHYLLARDGDVHVTRYWDVGDEPVPGVDPGDGAGLADRIRDLLEDSVRRRLMADVPVGAFLSGGLDSSSVVALMARHANPVRTFSLGFTVGGAYDELPEARSVAEALGTEHHELRAEHVDLVETLRRLVYHYDEPFGDPAGFPVFLLSQFAREHVKVVLTGDGGDELFGGYRRYAADQAAPAYQVLPPFLTEGFLPRMVDRLPRMRRLKRAVHSLSVRDPARRYASWLEVFGPDLRDEVLRPEIRESLDGHDPAEPYRRHYRKLDRGADHLNRLMYVDVKTWLADTYMEKTDKATMACSLEARLPFLDHRLVELAFQVPAELKVRGWSTKRILKRAVRDLVPDRVVHRRKHGFSVPTDPWFRGDLRRFTFEVLLDDGADRHGYVNRPVVERLWKEHVSGRGVWDEHLWLLLNLELWHRIFLDGERV